MSDSNHTKTIVRKEDLHQEVGMLRHADTAAPIIPSVVNSTPEFKRVTEHNYHTTTIVRKEGVHESHNSRSPDLFDILPSEQNQGHSNPPPKTKPAPDYSAPLPHYNEIHIHNTAPQANEKPKDSHEATKEPHKEIITNNHFITPSMPQTDHNKSHLDSGHGHGSQSVHIDNHAPHGQGHVTRPASKPGAGSKFVKALVVVGILVLLFFISIGIVKFVPKAIGSLSGASVYLSSLFSSKEELEMSFNKTEIVSGETLVVSWKNNSDIKGPYTWSFACADGIRVLYRSIDNSMQPVICETSFPIPENATSYPFVVTSLQKEKVKLESTLTLWNPETKEPAFSNTKSITVLPAGSEVETPEPEPEGPVYSPSTTTPVRPATTTATSTRPQTNHPVSSTATATAVGSHDMSITLISAQAFDSNSIATKPLTNVSASDKVIVKFRISNLGPNATGAWRLTASLPSSVAADQNFISDMQPSLQPGAQHDMTLMFDSYDPQKSKITITIENTSDTQTSNNTLSIPISGPYNSVGSTSSSADLSVRIIATGVMNPSNNAFFPTTNISQYGTAAVQFEAENKGGQATGYWFMRVDIPTQDRSYQTYGPLPSLAAGQKTQFTLGFDNPEAGSQTLQVRVDHNDNIRESNENNNQASVSLYVSR